MAGKFWTGDKLANLPLMIFAAVVAMTAIVFVAAGLAMDDFKRAWDTLTGQASPFTGEASGVAVALSALGYLLVPATIGLVVADGVTRFTRRRLKPLSEVQDEVKEMVANSIREAKADDDQTNPGTTL